MQSSPRKRNLKQEENLGQSPSKKSNTPKKKVILRKKKLKIINLDLRESFSLIKY